MTPNKPPPFDPLDDADLIAAYLEATRTMSMAERHQRTGISYTTHRRLAAGESDMHAETRRKILAFLSKADALPRSDREKMLDLVEELRDVADRMAEVLRGDRRTL